MRRTGRGSCRDGGTHDDLALVGREGHPRTRRREDDDAVGPRPRGAAHEGGQRVEVGCVGGG
ncbi:hypothetical protein H1Q78_08875 [Cellulosimicrobium cellulans]|nr:hypothetical protein [Cellulosimicrobium cellulans]UKJ62226.1 hypothetical protein H1Q78_08875 [Cellulosimicrobium cellulans]